MPAIELEIEPGPMEKGVKMPALLVGRRSAVEYPLASMVVGDSFPIAVTALVPDGEEWDDELLEKNYKKALNRVRAQLRKQSAQLNGVVIKTRRIDDGLRVWRVA